MTKHDLALFHVCCAIICNVHDIGYALEHIDGYYQLVDTGNLNYDNSSRADKLLERFIIIARKIKLPDDRHPLWINHVFFRKYVTKPQT